MQSIAGDVSPRQYARIEKNGRRAIFMDASRESEARPSINEFVRIARWLRENGIYAPEIYDVDTAKKTLILEDLGCTSFRQAVINGLTKRRTRLFSKI